VAVDVVEEEREEVVFLHEMTRYSLSEVMSVVTHTTTGQPTDRPRPYKTPNACSMA
jgi:hypothetical protein